MVNEQLSHATIAALRQRHFDWAERHLLPFYFGCRLKVLVVADNFLYFDDSNFGLSEFVATLRGMSSWRYPVTVDLAHRHNPSAARLAGATPNFTFTDASLNGYDQLWIFAAEYPSRDGARPAITDPERRAIRKFMDEGGGVFATGDHEDLGVTVGGYIPRVRSMRRWFFPSTGPQGEPVAPHGSNSSRHDTDREGHDAGWSFNDQSDDVPQVVTPHYLGGGLIRSVHPVLCTRDGPIDVLPDHAHEGQCEVPGNLGGNYSIGSDSFREYPDGPDGNPLRPQLVATATMIPGAAAPEFGKPPVPGGSFGVIAAWDGHRAGDYGRVVVDATWHHFININLIGDRGVGIPDPAVPKTMGFLHTLAGQGHLDRIKQYYRNIADWMTPKARRRCLFLRHIWAATNNGWFLENYRRDDLVLTGRLILNSVYWLRPCDRIHIVFEIAQERLRPFSDLVDPPPERLKEIAAFAENGERENMKEIAEMVPAALVGAIALQIIDAGFDVDRLRKEFGDEEAQIPVLEKAADAGIEQAAAYLKKRMSTKVDLTKAVTRLKPQPA